MEPEKGMYDDGFDHEGPAKHYPDHARTERTPAERKSFEKALSGSSQYQATDDNPKEEHISITNGKYPR